jgi:hypothetical protein
VTAAHRIPNAGIMNRRRLALCVGAAAVLLVGLASGTAFAYFATTSTGSGLGPVGSARAVDVTAVAGSSTLQPGSSSNLSLTLVDPNPYPVVITGVAENGTAATVSVGGGTGCTGTNAGVSVPATTSLHVTVGPGKHVVRLPAAVVMSTTSANGCQGATFHVPVKLEVKR